MKVSKDNNEKNKTTFKKIKQILNYIGKILSYACIVLLVLIGIFLVYYVITIQKTKTNKKDPKCKFCTSDLFYSARRHDVESLFLSLF